MKLNTTLLPLAACLMLATSLHAGDLVIELKGIRSDAGRAYVAIHQRSPGIEFPDAGGSVASFNLAARKGTIAVVLKDLPEGAYAVTAFHDENGSGELDRNILGVPTEGIAFGNDATGVMGPPTFDDAAVTVADDAVTATATIRY